MVPKQSLQFTLRAPLVGIAFLTSGLLGLPTQAHASALKLGSLFTDHMVLQREQAVQVWGLANAGEEITIEFAGQKKTAKADADGAWLVKLDPMPAAMEGRELVVRSAAGKQTLNLADVVVGDVWLCSGQSNMIFPMGKVENAKEEMASADHPAIRFFNVKQQFAREPMAIVDGEWKPVTPETVAQCSAVAYYFARDLQQKSGVPIGLLTSSVPGTRIETWMQPQTLSSLGLAGPLMDKWKNISTNELKTLETAYKEFQNHRDNVHPAAVALAKKQAEPIPPEPPTPAMRPHDCPGALHLGMIAPLQPFAIRGALWYQGESNIGNHDAYEKMLPALIADWRAVWGETMPFLIVQLALHKSITPEFREVQYRVWQKTPQTAMVVTTDVGNAEDLHPARKRPIGERLAVAARAVSYEEPIESSGPVFERMSVEGDRAVLSFAHIGDGLMVKGDSLKGFVVAGSDKKFFPAQAIIEGSNVIVTSEQVKEPVVVHYGNDRVPDVNFYNKNGLPAVPFRSDAPANPNVR